jgi:hypothetical protein
MPFLGFCDSASNKNCLKRLKYVILQFITEKMVEMDSKFQNVCLHKTDKRLLEKISEITGLSQSKILSMYIRILAEWVQPFSTATLLWDDSDCRILKNSNILKLKIEGIEQSKNFSYGVKSDE